MGVSAVIDDVRAGFIADACPTIELTTAEHLNAAVRVETRIHPFQRDADLTRLRAMAATLGAEDRWRHIERLRRAAARAVEQDLVLVAEDQAGAGPFLVPHGGRLEGEAPTAHHVESARKVRRRAPKKQRAVLGADLRDGAAVDFEVDDLLIGQHRYRQPCRQVRICLEGPRRIDVEQRERAELLRRLDLGRRCFLGDAPMGLLALFPRVQNGLEI